MLLFLLLTTKPDLLLLPPLFTTFHLIAKENRPPAVQRNILIKEHLGGKERQGLLVRMGLISSKQFKAKQAQVIMLGLDSAGKSTLLYKLKFNDVFVTLPTIGFNVEMIETGENITLTIWDVGGQHKMRTAWSDYLENIDGLVYVVDSTDKKRLEESKKELELILKNEKIKDVPVVVLANKQDLPEALDAVEITRRLNMKRQCHDRNWYVQPCCAITGEGLSAALEKVASFAKSCMKSKQETFTIFRQD